MSESFSTVCEHCHATLKLKNPDLVGKKVKCPKCGEAFVVTGESAATTKPAKKKVAADDDFMDYDASDYESLADDEEELDDEDDRPARRSRPTKGAKKKGKKSSKSKGNSNQVLTIVAIVLGVIAVLGGGGYGVVVLAKSATSDLDWLPTEIEGFAKVQPNELWNSSALQPLTSGDIGKQLVDGMTSNVGMGPQDIDRMLIGFPKGAQVVVMVVHSRVPFDLTKLQGSAQNAQSVSHAGRQYLKTGVTALFLADSKTLVCGPENMIQEIMTRGRQNPSASKFGFARGYRDQVVVAVVNPSPTSPSATSPSVGTGAMMGMGTNPMQNAEKFLLRANASSDINLSLQTSYKSADDAKGVVDKMQTQLNQQKTQLAQQKTQLQAMADNPFKQMMNGMEQVMNSLKVTQSGSQMNMEINLPGQIIKDAMEMAKASPFFRMPTFPSLMGK